MRRTLLALAAAMTVVACSKSSEPEKKPAPAPAAPTATPTAPTATKTPGPGDEVCPPDQKLLEDQAKMADDARKRGAAEERIRTASARIRDLIVARTRSGKLDGLGAELDAPMKEIEAQLESLGTSSRAADTTSALITSAEAGLFCRAVATNDANLCAQLPSAEMGTEGDRAGECRTRFAMVRAVAPMIASGKCDAAEAEKAAALIGAPASGKLVSSLCAAATGKDAAKCKALPKDHGALHLCQALAKRDAKACDGAGRKEACHRNLALLAAAASPALDGTTAALSAEDRALVEAAGGNSETCHAATSRRVDEVLATLAVLTDGASGTPPPAKP